VPRYNAFHPLSNFSLTSNQIDERTGMVMNLTKLKECMSRGIMDVMDHKNLVGS
jgi:6-pyruvoyl-tetrahydropterin synthase